MIEVFLGANIAKLGKKMVDLTKQEAEFLYVLSASSPNTVTDDQIANALWGKFHEPEQWKSDLFTIRGRARGKIAKLGYTVIRDRSVGFRIERITSRSEWTQEELNQLKALAESPKLQSWRTIAFRFPRHTEASVKRKASRLGIRRPKVHNKRKWNAKDLEAIRQAVFIEGLSHRKAAKRLGVTPGALFGALWRHREAIHAA